MSDALPTTSANLTVEVNGTCREIAVGTTLGDLLRELRLNPSYLAVERNLELVSRTQHESCVLQPGDQLEIVTLVGGG
jgi:thiamine biosynthesis protein ThiS